MLVPKVKFVHRTRNFYLIIPLSSEQPEKMVNLKVLDQKKVSRETFFDFVSCETSCLLREQVVK